MSSPYPELCRLCLNTENHFVAYNAEIGEQAKVDSQISLLFGFTIFQDDIHLHHICIECDRTIRSFWEFRERVIENQVKFPSIANATTGTESVDDHLVENSVLHFAVVDNGDAGSNMIKIEIVQDPVSTVVTENSASQRQMRQRKTAKTKDLDRLEEHLPAHLKMRMSKDNCDAQIREFVCLKCDVCENESRFETFKAMQDHYEEVHKMRGYAVCCDKKIFRKDRLMSHILHHTNPDAFKCPICGEKRKSKLLLKLHMKQHLPIEERPFKCMKCGQGFVLKSQLSNHEASHYTDAEKKYICEECGKAFALKFVMTKHKLTHSTERNFVCEICAKAFLSKSNLQSHMTTHHGDERQPRVQCSHCGLWYKNLPTLRTHMRRHYDNREHICITCGKQCTTKSSLASHIRYVHLNVREFECNICKQLFRRKLELTEHIARHTGQVLYSCPFCPKTFTSSSNYFSHRKNRHPTEFAVISKENILNHSQTYIESYPNDGTITENVDNLGLR